MQGPNTKQTWMIPAWVVALGAFILLLLVIASYVLFWPRHRDIPATGQTTAQQASERSAPPATPRQGPTARAEPEPVAPASPVEVTIPASTPITVRTAPLINGDDDPVGSRFSASLIAPVMVNGQTVLPQGAPALVRLIDKKKAGFFHRSARLKLALAGISVNGRIYPTATNVLELKPGNSPGGSGDSDNSGGDKPKGKKTLVVLPNTALTFTLETPLTVTVSPESMAPAGGR